MKPASFAPAPAAVLVGFLISCSLALGAAPPAPSPPPDSTEPEVDPERMTYGWIEFGGAILGDTDGHLSLDAASGSVDEDINVNYDMGFAISGGFRQAIAPWLAFEPMGGLLYNNVDRITTSTGTWYPDATLLQIPVMMDVVFQVPLQGRLRPFFGGGAGISISWLNLDSQLVVNGTETLTLNESSTEINFSYQGFAGLRLQMGRAGAMTLTYRYFGTGSPTWGLSEQGFGSVGSLNADNLTAQSVSFGFHMAL